MDRLNNQVGMTQARLPAFSWADGAVFAIAVAWGASYPLAKGALVFAPVLVLLFYRFLITCVVMMTVARRELKSLTFGDYARAVLLGAILFAIFITETYGVSATSATNATLIISLCVIFTPILDNGLSGRLPPAGVLAGAFVSCCGVAFLSGSISSFAWGDFLVLAAAVLRAVMVVSTKRLLSGRSMSSAALTALQASTVVGLVAGCLLANGDAAKLSVGMVPSFWAAVIFLSLICTVAAFYIQNAAVRRSSPTRVTLLMGTEPLFGCLMAQFLLSEPLTPAIVTGAAMIIAGTFAGIVFEQRKPQ